MYVSEGGGFEVVGAFGMLAWFNVFMFDADQWVLWR